MVTHTPFCVLLCTIMMSVAFAGEGSENNKHWSDSGQNDGVNSLNEGLENLNIENEQGDVVVPASRSKLSGSSKPFYPSQREAVSSDGTSSTPPANVGTSYYPAFNDGIPYTPTINVGPSFTPITSPGRAFYPAVNQDDMYYAHPVHSSYEYPPQAVNYGEGSSSTVDPAEAAHATQVYGHVSEFQTFPFGFPMAAQVSHTDDNPLPDTYGARYEYPQQPQIGIYWDSEAGMYFDPDTATYLDPTKQSMYFDSTTGLYFDPSVGTYFDPSTGMPVNADPIGPVSVVPKNPRVPKSYKYNNPRGIISQEERNRATSFVRYQGVFLNSAYRTVCRVENDCENIPVDEASTACKHTFKSRLIPPGTYGFKDLSEHSCDEAGQCKIHVTTSHPKYFAQLECKTAEENRGVFCECELFEIQPKKQEQ